LLNADHIKQQHFDGTIDAGQLMLGRCSASVNTGSDSTREDKINDAFDAQAACGRGDSRRFDRRCVGGG
jgi:hypothetical protein